MIVQHKATRQLYRTLMSSHDVATQKPHIVFMQLETGAIFNRSQEIFKKTFEVVVEDPQAHIIPELDY